MDACVVPKQDARVAYETEVRNKRSGPALGENVQGNIFQTKYADQKSFICRIYPVPANGERTIKIVYSQDLLISKESASYSMNLSTLLGSVTRLDRFAMSVSVRTMANVVPELKRSSSNMSGVLSLMDQLKKKYNDIETIHCIHEH